MTNTFLIGSNDTITIDLDLMRRRLASDPGSFQGIRKYGLTTAESLLAHYVASEEAIRPALPPGPVNSFEEPYYEFYSPGEYAVQADARALQNHDFLMAVRGADFDRTVLNGRTGDEVKRMQTAFTSEKLFFEGRHLQLQGMPNATVLPYYDAALKTWPENRNLRNEITSYLDRQYLREYTAGNYSAALEFVQRAAQLYPESSEVHYDYGLMLAKMDRGQEAILEVERSLSLDSRCVPAHRLLASLYAMTRQVDKAAKQWQTALSLDPDDVLTLVGYGIFLAEQQPNPQALNYEQKAYDLAPKDPEVIDGYARVAYLIGNIQEARRIVLKGGNYFAGNPFFEQLRAAILNGS